MRILTGIAMVWTLCASAAMAQAPEQGIIVTGEGRVSLVPDMAHVSLGVDQAAATAGEAMKATATAVAALITELDAQGIDPRDRQTQGFYLRPVYADREVAPEGAPRITGYRAGNTVQVTVRDLPNLGPVLDAMIATGANEFNGLRFGLQNSAAAETQARALAVADAMARGEELAQAAGVSLGRRAAHDRTRRHRTAPPDDGDVGDA